MVWNPLLDGDYLTGYPSQLMPEAKFLKAPLITGANTDETFSLPGTQNTEEGLSDAFLSWRSYALTPPTIRRLLELYPDDPCLPAPPRAVTNCTQRPGAGKQWRRGAAIGSDLVMIAQRRKMAELLTGSQQKVYSYRFDQRLWNGPEWDGVKHFQNVAFSFQNISGLLGPSPEYDSHLRLARAIGRAYVNFVYDSDPNGRDYIHEGGKNATNATGNGSTSLMHMLPHWPAYDLERPENMVLNATGSWVEGDDGRREGIAFINTAEVTKELLG